MGILNIIATPLGWVLKLIYDIVGNYGIALILFTLFTKVILFPLAWKQKKSSIRMAAFQPMINEINKKYRDNRQKQQEELIRLQQEHGFSATSGCLPLLIQMPILFGLMQVIYNPLTHLAGLSRQVIEAAMPIADGILGGLSVRSIETGILAAVKQNPQAFSNIMDTAQINFIENINMSLLGMDLTEIPSIKEPSILWIIPILSVVTMLVQQMLMFKLNGQKLEGAMKIMPIYSVLMFGYFSFVIPAGVSVYWIFSSVFGIAQDLVLRIFFDPEKEKKKIQEEINEARKKAKSKSNRKAIPDEKGNMTASQAELAKRRLEKARQIEEEKYGETK